METVESAAFDRNAIFFASGVTARTLNVRIHSDCEGPFPFFRYRCPLQPSALWIPSNLDGYTLVAYSILSNVRVLPNLMLCSVLYYKSYDGPLYGRGLQAKLHAANLPILTQSFQIPPILIASCSAVLPSASLKDRMSTFPAWSSLTTPKYAAPWWTSGGN